MAARDNATIKAVPVTRVFSGIQPTGGFHLGNYLGAVVQWVRMQHEAETIFCVVDLHAITNGHDPADLRARRVELATMLFAAGIDPEIATLFVQSHVKEHTELAWMLNCVATMGEVGRMVQYKEKSGSRGESVSVGLFDYPVLQAADILLYDTDEVPIGDDQRQHLELTRNIAQRFNHRFGETLVVPKAVLPKAGARVMDLQNPTSKMAKSSDGKKGTIQLEDTSKQIGKKIRSAVTDSDDPPVVRHDRDAKPGVANLLEILSAVSGREIDDLVAEFDGQMYGPLKAAVAEAVVEELRPVQERFAELSADPGEVERLLRIGADKARAVAVPVMERVREALGF